MCGYCDILNIDKEVDPPTPFDENDFNRMSNDVWIGAINNQVLPEGIYLKTAKYLRDGIDLTPVVDEILVADLTNNIYIFSGAKTYQQTRAMTAMLADPELQSNFYKFKEAVKPMFKLYNEDYLQAEYQTAKASARMASDWKRIEADADVLPLLQYQTVGDGRVRPTHQALDNIIRPISDPFWKQYYPPNGWRCRCTVIQLSEGQETDLSKFTPPNDVPPLFRMNAGIDGYVFKEKGKDKHPYFDIAKGDKEMAKKNWNLPIPQAPRPAPVVEVPKVSLTETTTKKPNPLFKNSTLNIDNKTLYRGDIRDKGNVFTEQLGTKDYLMDGQYKNAAGFHWFTDSLEYATDYATKQQSALRGEILQPILTKIKTEKVSLLDFKEMELKDQVNLIKSLDKFSDERGNNIFKYLFHNQKKIVDYDGEISEKIIDDLLGYKTQGKILGNGQTYSDFDTGIEFKTWLKDNGFDGYRFNLFKDDEFGFISNDDFKVIERKKL